MTIAARIEEAYAKLEAGDAENALIQLAIAVDATATVEHPKIRQTGARFKRFIKEYEDIITWFTLSGTAVVRGVAVGGVSLEDLAYEVLRCGMLHEGGLGEVVWTKGSWGRRKDGKLEVPKGFLYGLLMAVVAAPTNAHEHVSGNCAVMVKGLPFHINSYLGDADLLRHKIHGLKPSLSSSSWKQLTSSIEGSLLPRIKKLAPVNFNSPTWEVVFDDDSTFYFDMVSRAQLPRYDRSNSMAERFCKGVTDYEWLARGMRLILTNETLDIDMGPGAVQKQF